MRAIAPATEVTGTSGTSGGGLVAGEAFGVYGALVDPGGARGCGQVGDHSVGSMVAARPEPQRPPPGPRARTPAGQLLALWAANSPGVLPALGDEQLDAIEDQVETDVEGLVLRVVLRC